MFRPIRDIRLYVNIGNPIKKVSEFPKGLADQ